MDLTNSIIDALSKNDEKSLEKLLKLSTETVVPDSWKIILRNFEEKIAGLRYELAAYKYITKHILNNKIADTFLPAYYTGYCENKKLSQSSRIALKQIYGLDDYISSVSPIGICVTPFNGGYKDCYTLFEYLNVILRKKLKENKEEAWIEYKKIFFLIIYALYIMSEFKIVHNDLHSGNILLVYTENPRSIGIRVFDTSFKIETNYVPIIYDWDFSFIQDLGRNEKLTQDTCVNIAACNSFSEKRDLYQFLCVTRYYSSRVYENKELFSLYDRVEGPIGGEEKWQIKKELTQVQVSEIHKLNPYMITQIHGYVYKLYKDEFLNLLKKDEKEQKTTQFFEEHLKEAINVMFYLGMDSNRKIYIIMYKHGVCLPKTYHKFCPTPREILYSNFFEYTCDRKTAKSCDITWGYHGSYMKNRGLYIDPYIKSTRSKIRGEPTFTQRKTGLVRVYTTDSSS